MQLLTPEEIASARAIVAEVQAPTPTLRWPLLDARLGARAWVKHENHTRVGAFKLRGGAVYLHELVRREPDVRWRDQRDARQSRAVDRARCGGPRPGVHDRRAARQFGREERRNARARRDARRARRGLPAIARACREARRRARPAHGAEFSPRPGSRRRELLDGVLRGDCQRPASRRLRADRPGLRHQRVRLCARRFEGIERASSASSRRMPRRTWTACAPATRSRRR